MLIAGKPKELVFDERPADCPASGITVQLGHLFIAGDLVVLLVEIRGAAFSQSVPR